MVLDAFSTELFRSLDFLGRAPDAVTISKITTPNRRLSFLGHREWRDFAILSGR